MNKRATATASADTAGQLSVDVGDYAYVRPRLRSSRDQVDACLPSVHRGTVTAVRAGKYAVGDSLVEVTFDDVPVNVARVQEYYLDEIGRFTRPVPELRRAAQAAAPPRPGEGDADREP